MRERWGAFAPVIPEGESIESDEALRELLERSGFSSCEIERTALRASLTPHDLWSFACRSYPLGLLDVSTPAFLNEWFVRRAEATAGAEGRIQSSLALRIVIARTWRR